MIILSYSCRGDKPGNESQLKMDTIQKDFSFQVDSSALPGFYSDLALSELRLHLCTHTLVEQGGVSDMIKTSKVVQV